MRRTAVALCALVATLTVGIVTLPASGQQAKPDPSEDRFGPVKVDPIPPSALDGAQLARGRQREAYEADIAKSKDQREDRREHRMDDADESRSEALATLREQFPDVLASDPWDPMRLDPGDRLLGYVDAYAVQVKTEDHGTQLLTSALPLRSQVGNGKPEPVSLEMREGEETFRPANPLVKTVIEKDFDEGIAFPEDGYRIRLSGAATTDPLVEVQDKVFVGNLSEDIDSLITPTPTGVSLTLQIRSPAANEQVAYQFELREGLSLRSRYGDLGAMGVVGIEVVDGSEPIALVPLPSAVDADGRSVPVSMTLEADDKLVLTFKHRGADFRYPIAVDPVVDNYQVDVFGERLNNADPFIGWQFWGNSNNNTTVRPDPRFTDATGLGNVRGNGVFGNGLYVLVDKANSYHRNGIVGMALDRPRDLVHPSRRLRLRHPCLQRQLRRRRRLVAQPA